MQPTHRPVDPSPFAGPRVVRAAFVLAMLGWGAGFYGPPVYLHAVIERTGWPLPWIASAVTVHFLVGAGVVAMLPRLYARHGLPAVTVAGALATAVGVLGWALADAPWQVFAAAVASGAGWVAMGAVAINTVVARWYARGRPAALAAAYNGASIGGVVFVPLWTASIQAVGFAAAAAIVGLATVVVVAMLVRTPMGTTPEALGQRVDGDVEPAAPMGQPDARAASDPVETPPLPARAPWRDRRLATLAAGMTLGLFAQIGALAHLYALLANTLGASTASGVLSGAVAMAILGRALAVRALRRWPDRRRIASVGYAVQAVGLVIALAAGPDSPVTMIAGVLLFGSGIGNATSLPPLIAQAEFAPGDLPRVIALIVATAQAGYAFAPAAMGVVLTMGAGAVPRLDGGAAGFVAVTIAVQMAAIVALTIGRARSRRSRPSRGTLRG